MNEKQIYYFQTKWESKQDEVLLKIWKENNILEHSVEEFEAIRRILEGRKIYVPDQIPFDQSRMEKVLSASGPQDALRKDFSLKKSSKKPFPFYMVGLCIFATWIIFAPFIKDVLIHNPRGYYDTEEFIQAGSKRVFLDFVVFCISAFFALISGIRFFFFTPTEEEGRHNQSGKEGNQ